MRAVLPRNSCLVNQLQIRFVNERGRLQSVIAAFLAQIIRRHLFQFPVDERQQIVNRRAIAVRQLDQHFGDVFLIRHFSQSKLLEKAVRKFLAIILKQIYFFSKKNRSARNF
jgi:hypothetical protein